MKTNMPNFAKKTAILSIFAALSTMANPAYALVNINSTETYSVAINEDKFKNIADKLARTEERLARLYDVVQNIDVDNKTYTDAYVAANLPSSDVMQTGDQFTLYNTNGSVPTATVGTEPIVRLGSGSAPKTTTSPSGSTVLDMPDTQNISIDGTTYTFAGGTNSGVIAVGDMNNDVTRKIGGVSAGQITASSTEAVNGSQLYAAIQAIEAKKSGFTSVSAANSAGAVTYTFTSPDANVADGKIVLQQGKNITLTTSGNTTTIATADDLVADSLTTGGVVVNASGINMGSMKITNLADGTDNSDAVNFGQLKAAVANINVNGGWVLTDESGATSQISASGSATFKGDGKNITTKTDNNGALTVALKDNVRLESVTTGNVSMSGNGINAGNTRITNVSNGIDDSDAVNVSQLKQVDSKAEQAAGLAVASAAMNIEYVEQKPGQWVSGIGVATSGEHTALAIGTNFLSENGKYRVNFGYGQDLQSKSKPLFKTSFSFAW